MDLKEFADLDVPRLNSFGEMLNSNLEESYFVRHQSSPSGSAQTSSRISVVSIESQHLPDNHVESATGANWGGFENAINIEERRDSAQSRRLSSNLRVKYLYKNKKVTIPKTPNLRCPTRARKPAVDTPNA